MTRLGRLIRTTSFRLALVYLAVFSVASGGLILFISLTTTDLIDRQIRGAVDAEIASLSEQYQSGGITRLVRSIERRSIRPGASLYLITDFTGNRIAGNIRELKPHVPSVEGGELFPVSYTRLVGQDEDAEAAAADARRALARIFVLPGGFRLLVGRDVEERIEFADIIRRATYAAVGLVFLLALGSYLVVSRRVLKKIDAIAESGTQIVAGDMSERLPVDGSGDEFDRLAASVNAMLARSEQLNEGLKEVSDNIAHDLKTPLTRMRNRIEERLRLASSDDPDTIALLEGIINESESLIRTFDALLMIARVESVSTETKIGFCDVMEIARDIGELYEPVAEDAGARLIVDAEGVLIAPLNRELVRPMIANLVDNAIKYGRRTSQPEPIIRVSVAAGPGTVVVTVADNGPGIAAVDRERVTDRFVRLEKSRSAPGAGLGLSLVKAVVGYHRAKLELDDGNPGLIVRVTFPRHQPLS